MTSQLEHYQQLAPNYMPYATATGQAQARGTALPSVLPPVAPQIIQQSMTAAPVASFTWNMPQQQSAVAPAQPIRLRSQISDGAVGFAVAMTALAFVLTIVASFVAAHG